MRLPNYHHDLLFHKKMEPYDQNEPLIVRVDYYEVKMCQTYSHTNNIYNFGILIIPPEVFLEAFFLFLMVAQQQLFHHIYAFLIQGHTYRIQFSYHCPIWGTHNLGINVYLSLLYRKLSYQYDFLVNPVEKSSRFSSLTMHFNAFLVDIMNPSQPFLFTIRKLFYQK